MFPVRARVHVFTCRGPAFFPGRPMDGLLSLLAQLKSTAEQYQARKAALESEVATCVQVCAGIDVFTPPKKITCAGGKVG